MKRDRFASARAFARQSRNQPREALPDNSPEHRGGYQHSDARGKLSRALCVGDNEGRRRSLLKHRASAEPIFSR